MTFVIYLCKGRQSDRKCPQFFVAEIEGQDMTTTVKSIHTSNSPTLNLQEVACSTTEMYCGVPTCVHIILTTSVLA